VDDTPTWSISVLIEDDTNRLEPWTEVVVVVDFGSVTVVGDAVPMTLV
jgi:hypothetical protein